MTPLDKIRRAADIVRDSIAGDWFGYECKNDVQDLRRLAMIRQLFAQAHRRCRADFR